MAGLSVQPTIPFAGGNLQGGAGNFAPFAAVAPQPQQSSGGGGGGGGGGYSAPRYSGPSASQVAAQQAAAEAARINQLRSGFHTQQNNIYGTAKEAAQAGAMKVQSSIGDLIDSLRLGQNKVNNQATQAELAKRQGTQSVYDSVGRGIKSGGVMLANKNAANSSAAGALARAYGDIGRRDLSGVGNQYAQDENAVSDAQNDLDVQRNAGVRDIESSKSEVINNVVASARNQLAALDAALVNSSVPDRVNIEAEKNNIRDIAIQTLQQFDNQLQQGLAGIAPSSADDRKAAAAKLATDGVAADNVFQFDPTVPTGLEGSGPFAADIPLFRLNRKPDATASTVPAAPTTPLPVGQ